MPTFLGSVAANLFLAFGAGAGTALAVATFVADYGLLLGGLALSSSQAKKAKRRAREQFNAAQVDRLATVNTTVGPRELVLGRVRKGGNVIFRGSTGTNRSTFVMVVALAGHEIDAVEQIYLNDQAVTLDGSGNVQQAPYALSSTMTGTAVANGSGTATLDYTPIAGSVVAYSGTQGGPDGDTVQVEAAVSGVTVTTTPGARIVYQYTSTSSLANIRAVLGTDSQTADAALQALMPAQWTPAHRARGVAYLVCTFQYSETAFPQGLPQVSAVIRGAKCYDPRENRCVQSEDLSTVSWQAITTKRVTANTTTAPDGTLTADTLEDLSAVAYEGVFQSLTIANDSLTRTFSIYVLKTSGGTAPTFGVNLVNAGGTTVTRTLRLNTDTGAVAGSATGGVIDAGDYWRLWGTVTNNGTGNTTFNIGLYPATSAYGGGVSDVVTATGSAVVWGMQMVEGSAPKAYTATTATPVTPTTAWTQNPALHARHVYQHASFGKATVTAEEDDRIIQAANACDTSTAYVVGATTDTQALYRASLVVPFGTAAKDVLDDLAQAMGGSWAFAGGQLYVKAGTWTEPVMALTDADLAVVMRTGTQQTMRPIAISTHRARVDKVNTVNVQIWDQAQDYKQVALTPLTDAALVTADGASLVQPVTYSAIGYAPQALHVAGIMMRDSRDPLTVTLPVKLRAYPLELFDNVTLTLERYGWSAKEFQVVNREWTADGQLALTLKETAESIFILDAAFEAQGGAANTTLPSPWYVPPVGTLTISSGTSELVRQADGTVKSRMRVSWPAVDDSSVTDGGSIEIQYREATSTVEWTSVRIAGNETQAVITDVQDAVYYIVRARARNFTAIGDWGAQVSHQVVGKTEAPPPFDNFLVLAQPDGTRQYQFSYASEASKPIDWRGAEIRYIAGAVGSPDWDAMTPLVDTATFFTSSPVELNAPLSGEWTFACKSVDTSGNKSSYLLQTITLTARRLGAVFDEYYEHTEGWLGTLSGCVVEDGALIAIDTTTWATLPATWAGWTRWVWTPTTPISYVTPVRDFGAVIVGGVSSTIDADGSVTQELATSADGVTWSSWVSAANQFSSRYIKLRITVAATGPAPVPAVRSWSYQITAPIRSEYLNDVDISALTGSYRIGTGDIRIPLVGVYTVLKKTDVTIQDSSAGTWVATRIDQTLTYGPRWQFRLNGVLTDPSLVDFYVEGY